MEERTILFTNFNIFASHFDCLWVFRCLCVEVATNTVVKVLQLLPFDALMLHFHQSYTISFSIQWIGSFYKVLQINWQLECIIFFLEELLPIIIVSLLLLALSFNIC